MPKLLSAALVSLVLIILSSSTIGQTAASGPSTQSQTQEISPEKRALILELLEAMKMRQNARQVLDVMSEQLDKQRVEMIWQYLKDTDKLTPEEKANVRNEIAVDLAQNSKQFFERLNQRIDYGKVIEEIGLELYAKYYDQNELRDLVSFYKSPTGKKSLEIMPTLLGESMMRAGERLVPVIEEISKEIARNESTPFQKRVDDLVKSHHRAKPKNRSKRG